MTTEVQEKTTKTVKSEGAKNTTKEKVRADEDVIGFAETHELEGKKEAKKGKAKSTPKEEPQEEKKEAPKKKSIGIIKGTDRLTGKTIQMELDDITALSRYIYVHNIFDPTPVIEAVNYRAIAPGTTHVVMDIPEATFEDLRQLPRLKGHVHYDYVDGMLKNDPAKNMFYHRTFHTTYPEWIKPEDAKAQAKAIVSHYGIPDLSGIEKVLWPDFAGKIVKQSLSEDVPEPEEKELDTPDVVEEEDDDEVDMVVKKKA